MLESTILKRIAVAINRLDMDELIDLHNTLTSCKPIMKWEDIEPIGLSLAVIED